MDEKVKRLYEEAGRALKQAQDIMREFDGKEMLQEKVNQVDQLLDESDRKSQEAKRLERAASLDSDFNTATNRLGTSGALDAGNAGKSGAVAPEVKAFQRYLRHGSKGLSEAEAKALRADDDEAGGFLTAPHQVAQGILQKADDLVVIRSLAHIEVITGGASLGIISLDEDLTDPEWTSELSTGSEDNVKPFGKRALEPHPLAKRVKISKTLIRNSTRPIEQIVQQRLGVRYGAALEKGYMTGSGARQPLGVFTASDSGIGTDRDVTYTVTTDKTKADSLLDFVYHLKSQYRRSSKTRMISSRAFIKSVRKLRDANDQFIWTPGLGTVQPETILEIPVIDSEYAPSTISSGNYLAVAGDFQFYYILDSLNFQIQVLTELYAETNQNGYIGRYEGDGAPVLGEAFARLKHA